MKYTPNITVPGSAKAGEIIEIKTLIPHEMLPIAPAKENNQVDTPARFIENFSAMFNDKAVFSANLTPSISANPYISFYMKVSEPGTFTFTWTENNGQIILKVQEKLQLK